VFNVGGAEILVILLVALIVLGPDRLPQAVRQAGQFVGELRKMSAGFQNEIRGAFDDAEMKAAEKKAIETRVEDVGAGATATDAAAIDATPSETAAGNEHTSWTAPVTDRPAATESDDPAA
jgi:sec-independent protein translocase protein TatB